MHAQVCQFVSKTHGRRGYVEIVGDDDPPPTVDNLRSARVHWQSATFNPISAGNRNLLQGGKGLVRWPGRDRSERSTVGLADVPHGGDPVTLHRTC